MNFMEELGVKGRGKGSRSSNVNEVIRAILNFLFFFFIFFFFYKRILHAQQAQNAHKGTKIKKAAFSFA